jgi:hypothetical protein
MNRFNVLRLIIRHFRLTIFLLIFYLIGISLPLPAMAVGHNLNILFIGNSFSVWNNLPDVIKRVAEDGNPQNEINYTTVVAGGQTLETLWENYHAGEWLRISKLTIEEQRRKCVGLKEEVEKDQSNRTAFNLLRSQQRLLKLLTTNPPNWDYVVLQSYKDTDEGMDSSYAKYARKFAEVAKAHGIRVLLYGASVRALNARPLDKAPDIGPIKKEAEFFGKLAKELDATVVPVFYGVYRCQKEDPKITLRWKKNGHPHQRCTYLTALMFYSVLFDKKPQDIPINEVCFRKNKGSDTDPDGNPRCLLFSDHERLFFQEIAWQSVQEFKLISETAK